MLALMIDLLVIAIIISTFYFLLRVPINAQKQRSK